MDTERIVDISNMFLSISGRLPIQNSDELYKISEKT